MKNILLVILGILFFYLNSKAQEFELPEGVDKVEIPVEVISNILIAKAKVNGADLKFILDSGALNSTIFNLNGVDSLSVGQGPVTTIRGYGSLEPFEAIKSLGNQIEIESLISPKATINVLTESQISFLPILGTEVNGIIGVDFFKNYLIELNYRKNKVIVHRSLNESRFKKFKKVPLSLNYGKMYINAEVTNNLSSMNTSCLIDTGSGDALWLFEKTVDFEIPKKGFRDYLGFGISGEVYGFRSKLDQLSIADFDFNRITFALPEVDQSLAAANKNVRASIGGEVLRRFSSIIDYKSQAIFFKSNKSLRKGFYYNMAGLKLRQGDQELVTNVQYNYDKDLSTENRAAVKTKLMYEKSIFYSYHHKIIISYVVPDSPADRLGVKVGDQIVGYNKKGLGEFSMGELSNKFYNDAGSTLELRLKRGDKYIQVKIDLDPVID